MKKFVTTLKNIWSIEELRNKIIFTIVLLFIYRLGSFIVLPGIDPNKLANLQNSAQGGMLGLLDAFVGGAFSKASIFALGILFPKTSSVLIIVFPSSSNAKTGLLVLVLFELMAVFDEVVAVESEVVTVAVESVVFFLLSRN